MELNEFEKDMTAATFAQAGEHQKARDIMADMENKQPAPVRVQKKKPVLSMIIFGAMSMSMYIALLLNQDRIMDIFTKGGMNAFWPLGTAMMFSFIHGAFASNLLSVLGLEAKKH